MPAHFQVAALSALVIIGWGPSVVSSCDKKEKLELILDEMEMERKTYKWKERAGRWK